MRSPSDVLVIRAQDGDHDAFSRLLTDRIPGMYRVAAMVTRNPELSEDAVQESLIRAWTDLPRLRDPGRFDAWLRRLLVNACRDEGRRRGRRRREVRIGAQQFVGDRDPAHDVTRHDELERAFERLRAEDRAVIVLRHYVGLSTAEAAEAMSMREGTFKARLHRAMKQMAAAIAADARPPDIATRGRTA